MKSVVVVAVVVVFCAVVLAQAAEAPVYDVECYTPQHSDAGYLVSLLWGQTRPEMEVRHFFPHFAANLVREAVDGLPDTDRRRVEGVCAWTYTREQSPLSTAPATALAARPSPDLCANMIMLTGTAKALAEADVALKAHDMPRLAVYLEVLQVDVAAPEVAGWELEWTPLQPMVADKSLGKSSAEVPTCRYSIDPENVALKYLESRSPKLHVLGSEVTVVNDTQAIVALGEVVPIRFAYRCCEFTGSACVGVGPCLPRYCRPWCHKAIFQGIELWVQPTIGQDDAIAMVMRPRLTEWAGELCCPEECRPVPITRYQSAKTAIEIREGESIVITGLHRDNYVLNQSLKGFDRLYREKLSANPTLIITPKIVKPPQG